MPLKFQTGDDVRQVVPVIKGKVADAQIIEGEVHYLVEWQDGEGNPQSRTFSEDQIEAAPPA